MLSGDNETAINLAVEFGVSERTIRADLVILSCYYPIQIARGRFGGGAHLPDWFHMRIPHIVTATAGLVDATAAKLS